MLPQHLGKETFLVLPFAGISGPLLGQIPAFPSCRKVSSCHLSFGLDFSPEDKRFTLLVWRIL